MSAGAFFDTGYQIDNGDVHPIRIQPETLLLTFVPVGANGAPAGAITGTGSAVVSRGRSSLGINARLVRFKFIGALPTGYKADSVITLPWLNPATFANLKKGLVGTYLGGDIKFVGKRGEDIK